MVRATLERILTPETIDGIFAGAAVRQHQGELLFSSVVNLLAAVVWRQRDSINQAYKHAQEKFDVSVRSVYNKLNGTETQVCRELVRQTAQPLVEVVDRLKTRRPPQLKGYQTRIIDGNHLASTEHRLKVLRRTGSGPLPGQALAVLDPDRMLIVDLFPCEDGEAQERRIFSEVISSVQPRDLWIGDRNFCTTGFLFGIDGQGGSFVIRQHASTLSWETETQRKRKGRGEKSTLFEQQLHLQNGSETLVVRCITVQLDEPTRFGETEIRVLTNLPQRDASARKVAALYLERWTIEIAFQEIEQSLRSEINTLGYPGAALLGFSIAVMTYNALSVGKWAIEKEHGNVIQREEVSGYYLASAVAADYGGMMIALPAEEWTRRFSQLSIAAFIKLLRECARHVRPDTFRKTKRGPKKPRPNRSSGKIHHHVSTARLLAAQKC
jgi:IS4 transposase